MAVKTEIIEDDDQDSKEDNPGWFPDIDHYNWDVWRYIDFSVLFILLMIYINIIWRLVRRRHL